MAEETKTAEPATELLDEAMDLSHQAIALRNRLADTRRKHAQLLADREEKLSEGTDVLPDVKRLFLEIESLPLQITQLEQRVRWIATQFVEQCNNENSRRAGAAYMRNRDNLREALLSVRDVLASVEQSMRREAAEGQAAIGPVNLRLAEIERVLNTGPLPRTVFQLNPLPVIDRERVSRGQLLAAIEAWISALR